jgi:hypothetical protein
MCLALDVANLVYFILKNSEKKSFKIRILFHFMKKIVKLRNFGGKETLFKLKTFINNSIHFNYLLIIISCVNLLILKGILPQYQGH